MIGQISDISGLGAGSSYEAENYYIKLVHCLDPYKAETHYRKIGRLDEAIKVWKEYANREVAKKNFDLAAIACERVAEIYRELGESEEAEKHYEMAGKLYVKAAMVYPGKYLEIVEGNIAKEWEFLFESAARVYRSAGKKEKEKEVWKTMVEMLKQQAEIRLVGIPTYEDFYDAITFYKKIADIYENKLKDPEKAEEAWATIVELKLRSINYEPLSLPELDKKLDAIIKMYEEKVKDPKKAKKILKTWEEVIEEEIKKGKEEKYTHYRVARLREALSKIYKKFDEGKRK